MTQDKVKYWYKIKVHFWSICYVTFQYLSVREYIRISKDGDDLGTDFVFTVW